MTEQTENLDVEETAEEGVHETPTLGSRTSEDDVHDHDAEATAIETRTPEEEHDEEADTFPRDYVEKLRKESAGYREKAKKAEDYARELFHARVAATGRLADPEDLPFDERLLDDRDALLGAVEDLLARKPHLGSRTPRGDVGQGASEQAPGVDLAGILRSRA
ncbi:MAG TPA: hypothetical protein H9805_06655 [Candidatus Janibacter merdipullorum]|nr:hypothetical protein [Candidatus Janibacter merdipullorum]